MISALPGADDEVAPATRCCAASAWTTTSSGTDHEPRKTAANETGHPPACVDP